MNELFRFYEFIYFNDLLWGVRSFFVFIYFVLALLNNAHFLSSRLQVNQDYYSAHVNPQVLSCPVAFFDHVISAIEKKYVLLRTCLMCVQYDKEHVQRRIRPLPDDCRLINDAELNQLADGTDVLDMVEEWMSTNRRNLLPILTPRIGAAKAISYIQLLEHQAVRLLLKKPPVKAFSPNVTGKLDKETGKEKLETMRVSWLKYLKADNPYLAEIGSWTGVDLEEAADDEEVVSNWPLKMS